MLPRWIITVILLILFCRLIAAVEIYQTPPEDAFLKKIFTTDEGLPQNTVTDIVQTGDGYLWLGTFGGLVRFDGLKFTVFTTSNTPELVNNRISALYEDQNRILWIGSEDGDIVNYQNGVFTLVKKNVGAPTDRIIRDLYVDQNDILWIGTDEKIRTYNIKTHEFNSYLPETFLRNEGLAQFQKDPANFTAKDFTTDSEGTVWIATTLGLISYRNNKFTNFTTVEGLPHLNIGHIAANSDGGLWLAFEGKTVGKFKDNTFTSVVEPEGKITNFQFDSENRLYFASKKKFYTIDKNQIQVNGSLESELITARLIFIDREKNIWIGSNNFLMQLRKRNVKTFAAVEDKVWRATSAIVETSDKSIWVAASPYIMRWKNGVMETVFSNRSPEMSNDNYSILSLAAGNDNVVYFNSVKGVYQIKDEKVSPVQGTEDMNLPNLFVDRDNKLWIGERSGGFYQFINGAFKKFTTKDGLANNWVARFFQDSKGIMWLGTKGGVSRFENGEFTNYTSQDGLINENIRDIYEDADGVYWIGTYGGGISRLKDNKIVSITSQNGLAENIASRILPDDNGNFWILGNQGIYTVSRQALNDFADRKASRVYCTVFDEKDGMEVGEGNGGNMTPGIRASDGRFWFPMIRGGVIIESVRSTSITPPAFIESVSLERQPASSTEKLEIQPNKGNLEIAYTAVSFVKPDQIQFRYKLEGFDNDWQDVGTRRTAYYPYLPSGTYKFLVSATNGNGVWSEKEAGLDIVVYAPFWRTWQFFLLLFFVLIGVIVVIYQRRLKFLKRRRLRQEEFSRKLINAHESERSRIAGELHDSLGQNLLIIKNWSLLVLKQMPVNSKFRKQILEISETASLSLDETRSISRNLRPQHLQRFGLTETIRSMVKQIEESCKIKFNAEIQDVDHLFNAEDELSIYRIIQESLNNILKHSAAENVEIKIQSAGENLEITNARDKIHIKIKDDGKGFDIESKRKTSFGLDNIEQRAQLLGGNYSIRSKIGQGTEIDIYIKSMGLT